MSKKPEDDLSQLEQFVSLTFAKSNSITVFFFQKFNFYNRHFLKWQKLFKIRIQQSILIYGQIFAPSNLNKRMKIDNFLMRNAISFYCSIKPKQLVLLENNHTYKN